MSFLDTCRLAARIASDATENSMLKYRRGLVTDEDDLTGVLLGNLDAGLEGRIGDLNWSSAVVRHRRGRASEEDRTGADIIIHVKVDTPNLKYSKGVLVQAKRLEPNTEMNSQAHERLLDQCQKMTAISSPSYIFDYAKKGMRVGSATRIAGSKSPAIYEECDWTPYRFFFELFRCPIGDARLTSAQAKDLPVHNILEIKAKSQVGLRLG